ncbi:hypothetical protein RTCIAT899_PC06445 (plasmid) [Rhizobium tropici CIAT 899]|nr:hypothetical protein RTCIAT899_PC06445 [Rhizobium tropici CIAT 899]
MSHLSEQFLAEDFGGRSFWEPIRGPVTTPIDKFGAVSKVP